MHMDLEALPPRFRSIAGPMIRRSMMRSQIVDFVGLKGTQKRSYSFMIPQIDGRIIDVRTMCP